MSTMRERLRAFMGVTLDAPDWFLRTNEHQALAFTESEVRAALEPREPSPELAKRFVEIMAAHADEDGVPTIKYAALAELLVAEVARLPQPSPTQSTDWRRLASDLRDAVMATTPSAEDVAAGTAVQVARACEAVREALKCSVQAQDRATRVVLQPLGHALIAQLCTEARRDGVITAEGIAVRIAEKQREMLVVDPKCAMCGEPATCYGRYEAMTEDDFACDGCCGHGCEDGHCEQLVTAERVGKDKP